MMRKSKLAVTVATVLVMAGAAAQVGTQPGVYRAPKSSYNPYAKPVPPTWNGNELPTDAPVESPNPFWGLHAAVTRRNAAGAPGPDGWYPEQRLSVLEALRAYTTGAAYAAGTEDRLGRLAPGYYADLLVLDTDPFTCPAEALREIKPSAVMFDGEWVVGE